MDLSKLSFPWAIDTAIRRNDRGPLVRLLRLPSLEITMEDRELLAQFIAGEIKRPRGRPLEDTYIKRGRALQMDAKIMSSILDELRPPRTSRPLALDFPAAHAIFGDRHKRDPRCTDEQVKDLRKQSRSRRL